MKRLKAVRTNDQGFTLVELLMTIVILGIIIGAVGTATMVGLRTTAFTGKRLAEDHDAQLITSYFVSDVQSSDAVTATALDSRCTAGVTGSPVVSLGWTEAGVLKVAEYVTQNNTGSECPPGLSCSLMMRYFCVNGVSTGIVIAHILSRTNTASITCTTASPPSSVCNGTPDAVVIAITPVDTAIYAPYTVAGLRRDAL